MATSSAPNWLTTRCAWPSTSQGRIPEAIAKFEHALRAGEELLGPNSPHLFPILTVLGNSYYTTNRPADSLALFQRLMAMTPAMFGARHPTHGQILHWAARAYRALGRPSAALPLDEQNLAIQVTTHGRAHPETVRAIVAMIDDYYDLGNQVELNRYLELAETLISTVAGVDDFCITNVKWHREQQRTRS
jgi:tetratricopeptide (TPR) repeat protein